ncbi:hypothetical protein KPH14_001965 [Odynerus spinipes]|uniref:Uncharacterized protein n=1 Tax=Odynerus spinipes TaxID=1348599 RepID=A0AAD9VXT5_9HYME|nr:hypothetical protein KPH14_001965 [Odynerus spinipes]
MSDESGLDGGEEDEEEDKEDRVDRIDVCSIDNVLSVPSPRSEDDSGRSVTTIISEKIRSKLPSISERFKSLLRSIGTRQQSEEAGATFVEEISSRIVEEVAGISSSRHNSDETTTLNVTTISREENPAEDTSIDLSTSSMFSTQDDDSLIYPAGRIVSFADGSSSGRNESQRITRMVSNSMNTVEITTDFNLENILAGGAIIAENPMEFAAVLSIPLGIQEIREPRSVPLDYGQDENHSETYLEDHTSGDISITESSTIGSEVSSYTEVDELERRDQATGQDNEPPILFYNPRISAVVRKPLCQQDDEPSIY